MKLINFLPINGDELTVVDNDYDIETYCYYTPTPDLWDGCFMRLAKILDATPIRLGVVSVNLSQVIEKNLDALEKADLFIYCDIDVIMDDIEAILAGNVSEKWLDKFVTVLEKGENNHE